MTERVLQLGDEVTVVVGERRIGGKVILASPNGRALIVECEGMVHGFVGPVPLLLKDDGQWTTITDGPIDMLYVR